MKAFLTKLMNPVRSRIACFCILEQSEQSEQSQQFLLKIDSLKFNLYLQLKHISL